MDDACIELSVRKVLEFFIIIIAKLNPLLKIST